MSVYIGYRNLPLYFSAQNQAGGIPENTDTRLAEVKSGIYLLTFEGQNYAVSKERGQQFTEEVLSKCTDKHRGFFPLGPSYNGQSVAAVIEIHKDRDLSYYDMDAEELLKMLTALRDESGAPLDRRGVINHCYPNPKLPEGDFILKSIYHQKFIPDNNPPAVIQTTKPDKVASDFWIYNGEAHIEVREGNIKNKYDVPAEFIPEIKAKVRQLCEDPAEAYVEDGAFEAFVKFGEDGEKKIFTKPDETLALLKEIASKSVFKESEELKGLSFYGGASSMFAFQNLGMSGMSMMQAQQAAQASAPAPAPVPEPDNIERCVYCGEPRNGKKFCTNCGGEFK
ncbi:MAG: hypothetical protein IKT10_05175 [Clostridiales bacterium]|nr:hypothetical protein [Clostridiales bacterium]